MSRYAFGSFIAFCIVNHMANQSVSILGCGWLGKALGKILVASGHRVTGSTTRAEKVPELESAGITPFVFNVDELSSSDLVERFFSCDVLVIGLPQGTRRGKAEEYVDQINTVMQAAKTGNTKNVILISTTSVYPNLNRVVKEEDADPRNPLVKAETIVLESGIPGTVIRFAGLFGPGRDPGRFLAGKCDVSGGNVPVNLIHLDDCIEIIKQIIEKGVWKKVVNACADEHPTKKEFYTHAALVIGLKPPTFSDVMNEYKIVSNALLKESLGFEFVRGLIV